MRVSHLTFICVRQMYNTKLLKTRLMNFTCLKDFNLVKDHYLLTICLGEKFKDLKYVINKSAIYTRKYCFFFI